MRWRGARWDEARWRGVRREVVRWRGARRDEARWRGARREEARWRAVRWDEARWRGARRDEARWRGARWEEARWRGVRGVMQRGRRPKTNIRLPPATSSEGNPESSSTSAPSITSSIDLDSFLGPEHPTPAGVLTTFKIVGDNIDKDIKPRNMRSDYQTRSLHYFHAYAVRDRLNLDSCDDSASAPDPSSINLELLLPSAEDRVQSRHNMGVLIARTLKKHMPFFSKYGKGLERHIRHGFYEEMSRKSTVATVVSWYI